MHWINPDSLPEVKGTVERFVLNHHGEVDGLVMTEENSTILVHTPPHMEAELTRHVSAGDTIAVRGVQPRGAALLAAVAVTAHSGRQIVDQGPDRDRDQPKLDRKKMEAEGTVRLSLFGPKGELRGALLADSTAVRIGPKEAKDIAKLLTPGARIAVRGDGVETRHGRVIHAKEVGHSAAELRPVKPPKPNPKPKHHHEAHA
jgi:hypothetical protein